MCIVKIIVLTCLLVTLCVVVGLEAREYQSTSIALLIQLKAQKATSKQLQEIGPISPEVLAAEITMIEQIVENQDRQPQPIILPEETVRTVGQVESQTKQPIKTDEKTVSEAAVEEEEPIDVREDHPEITDDISEACRHDQKILIFGDVYSTDKPYSDIDEVMPFPELPICILAYSQDEAMMEQIYSSIKQQSYTNHRSIYLAPHKPPFLVEERFTKATALSYDLLDSAISKCQRSALIFIVTGPLTLASLNKLNDLHQQYNTWLTFSEQDQYFHVHSFYRRLFELVRNNDFDRSKAEDFKSQSAGSIGLALLELSKRFKKKIDIQQYFQPQIFTPMAISKTMCVNWQRIPYQELFSLAQDYPALVSELKTGWRKFLQNKEKHYNGYIAKEKEASISQTKGIKAVEYEELLYLPGNHSLAKREYQDYNLKYHIKRYEGTQLPICITVPSRNNMAMNKYKRAMLSILKQKYSNYHIVFLDDGSEDDTLNQTRLFLQEEGFPKERVKYIRNLRRKYATYNIVHAAHSYCQANEIQMILDGDDMFIGYQVLRLFNALYQRDRNVWVAYSTYISTYFTYGESYPVKHKLDDKKTGGRKKGHYIGLERSWYVGLIRQIPLSYHQWMDGEWLNVMADDSLQYSLYELAGDERFKYFPEINYYYTMVYNNEEIKVSRKKVRDGAHKEAIAMTRLHKLDSLEGIPEVNQQLMDTFEADRGKEYFEIPDGE